MILYGIKNSVNEWNERWSKFASTKDKIEELLEDCEDWYDRKGTEGSMKSK